MQSQPYFLTAAEREIVAQAAIRRAAFLRDEVRSGRIPASHPLASEYLAQAERLELMYPAAAAAAEGDVRAPGVVIQFPCQRRRRRGPSCEEEDR